MGAYLMVGVRLAGVWVPGQLVGKSAGLVIQRLRVRIPARAAGELSSPELTLCADFYSVYIPPLRYRSGI